MGIEVIGDPEPGVEEILTPAALEFLLALQGQFAATRVAAETSPRPRSTRLTVISLKPDASATSRRVSGRLGAGLRGSLKWRASSPRVLAPRTPRHQ